jgi:hypothetical protein
MIDNNLKLLFALPLLLIALSFAVVDFIPFRSVLTPEEQQVINFTPDDLSLPAVNKTAVDIDLTRPLELVTLPEGAQRPSPEQPAALPQRKVEMIVIGGLNKMAVIDGTLVREGDSIGTLIVKTIESNRVLVKNASPGAGQKPEALQQWLYLEDAP